MESSNSKLYAIAFAILPLLLVAYLTCYSSVRRESLSIERLGPKYAMMCSSSEGFDKWLVRYEDKHGVIPFIYDDYTVRYIMFWPVIQMDSLFSGREVDSPFDIEPYLVPSGSGAPLLPAQGVGETDPTESASD